MDNIKNIIIRIILDNRNMVKQIDKMSKKINKIDNMIKKKLNKAATKKAKQIKKGLEGKNLSFPSMYSKVFDAVRINFPSLTDNELYIIVNRVFKITKND